MNRKNIAMLKSVMVSQFPNLALEVNQNELISAWTALQLIE